MTEKVTIKFSDEEKEAIRARAAELAGGDVVNDEWGRTEELTATRETVKNSTGAAVAYLLQREIRDDSPDVNEYGEPV